MVRIPDDESFGGMKRERAETNRHVKDLERPDGAQIIGVWERIKALVAGIDGTVQAAISLYSYTRAQIESLSWLGILQPGKGGTGTTNAANNIFTSGGPWNVIYGKTATGELGHAPSLRELKQDIRAAFPSDEPLDPLALLTFPVLTYRFRDDVDDRGDDAIPQYGMIAEDLEDAGFEPLLIRDADDNLFGIAYDRMWMMHHEILRVQQAHIDDLSRRIADLEGGRDGSV